MKEITKQRKEYFECTDKGLLDTQRKTISQKVISFVKKIKEVEDLLKMF